MPRRKESPSDDLQSRSRPATTPEEREQQMISLADSLAERQLRDGTASSQVITHYLKLASSRERLEQQKLELEKDLLRAKAEAIAGQQRQEELFARAISAMRSYQGIEPSPIPFEEEFDAD